MVLTLIGTFSNQLHNTVNPKSLFIRLIYMFSVYTYESLFRCVDAIKNNTKNTSTFFTSLFRLKSNEKAYVFKCTFDFIK